MMASILPEASTAVFPVEDIHLQEADAVLQNVAFSGVAATPNM
jgi:hypothetical protein